MTGQQLACLANERFGIEPLRHAFIQTVQTAF